MCPKEPHVICVCTTSKLYIVHHTLYIVLVSFFLNSSFRLNGREDLREEETLTLIQ